MKLSNKGAIILWIGAALGTIASVYGIVVEPDFKPNETVLTLIFLCFSGLFLMGTGFGIVLASKKED